MVLKRLFISDTDPFLHIFRSQGTELGVSMIVLVARWSWNGHFLVTLGKTWFIWFRSWGKQSLKPFSQEFWAILPEDRASSQYNSFSTRWSWKGHLPLTFGKTQIICSGLGEIELQAVVLGDAASSWHDRFSGKMVLKRLLLGDTGETQLICSGLRETEPWAIFPSRQSFGPFSWETELWAVLPRDTASSRYNIFSWKSGLEKAISWCHWEKIQLLSSGLRETELLAIFPGDRALSQHSSLSGNMVLKRPFLSDTGEDSAHLFRS